MDESRPKKSIESGGPYAAQQCHKNPSDMTNDELASHLRWMAQEDTQLYGDVVDEIGDRLSRLSALEQDATD